jgi:hypothetical protein
MYTRRVQRWLVRVMLALVVSFSIVPQLTLAADGGLAQPDSQYSDRGGGGRFCDPKNSSPDKQCGW